MKVEEFDNEILVFALGAHLVGIPLLQVLEVVHERPTTPVPRSPDWVSGIFWMRGRVVTAIDLARYAGLPVAPSRFFLVLRSAGEELAFSVSEVHQVLRLPEADLERARTTEAANAWPLPTSSRVRLWGWARTEEPNNAGWKQIPILDAEDFFAENLDQGDGSA